MRKLPLAAYIGFLVGGIGTTFTTVLAADSGGNTVQALEEIVVTARRREESLQEIPLSVTALTPDMMKAKGISQPYDLVGNVPGLSVQAGSASRNDVVFFIRGQGQVYGSNPSVVQYFAETPVNPNPAVSGQNVTYYDLEQIQVLKGPQGTLFGRPTVGGAVLINPKRPSYEFDGFIETKLGNYSSREITGAVNIPIIDDMLAVRIAGNVSNHDGYSTSYITGQELDDRDRDSFRVGVLFEPVEWLSNYTLYEDNTINEAGTSSVLTEVVPDHPLLNTTPFAGDAWFGVALPPGIVPGLQGVCYAINDPSNTTGIQSCISDRLGRIDATRNGLISEMERLNNGGDIRSVAHSQNNFVKAQTQQIINITEFHLGEVGFLGETTVKNIFQTNRTVHSAAVREIGGSPINNEVALSSVDIVNGLVVESSSLGSNDWMDQFSNEIQFSGSINDMHDWVLGYFHEQFDDDQYFGAPSLFLVLDGAFTVPVGMPGVSSGFTDNFDQSSDAFFGQTTLDLAAFGLEDFKLTLGYRYSEFEQTLSSVESVISPDGLIRLPGGNVYSDSVNQKEDTFTIALDWQVNDDLLLYGTHRRGFKQGGINIQGLAFADIIQAAQPTFEPEEVKDYEVGAKLDWAVGSVYGRTNVALFLAEFSNQHRNQVFFNGQGVSTQIENIAESEVKGLELESTLRLTDNLQLDISYSYLDAEYKKWPGTFVRGNGDIVNMVDQQVPMSPENIFGGTLQYWLPMVPAEYGTVKASVNYTFQDSLIFEDGSPYNPDEEEVGSYGLWNFRLDWQDVMGNPVDVAFFMRNIDDEVYQLVRNDFIDSLGNAAAIYGDPKVYGFEIRARFGASAE